MPHINDPRLIRTAVLTLAIGGIAALATPASGQVVWDGEAGDNDWFTDTNWSTDFEPALSDNAVLNNGDTIVIDDSGTATGNFVDVTGADGGTIDIRPGAVLQTSDSFRVGVGPGGGTTGVGNGNLIMTGGTVTIDVLGGTAGADFAVGDQSGSGTANISGGTITAPDNLLVGGPGTFSSGVIVQSGGDITVQDGIFVGGSPDSTGDYTLSGGTLTNGGTAGSGNVVIGNAGTASGVFNQTGGTLTAIGMNIGNSGTGEYSHSGGDLVLSGDLNVAANSGATGTLTVTGSDGSITAASLGGDGTSNFVFEFEDSSGSTTLDIAGIADLDGAMIDLNLLGHTPVMGDTFDLITASSITGAFTLDSGDDADFDLDVVTGGNGEILQATFTAIPEPGSAMLAVAGAGLFLRRRRSA